MRFTIYSLPLFASAILMIGLAVYARYTRKTRPETTAFALLMLATAIYMIGYGLEIMAESLALKVHLTQLEYVGIVSISGLWLVLILCYTGRHHLVTRRNILLLAIVPVIILVVFFTNGLHHLYYRDLAVSHQGSFPALIFTIGPLYLAFSVYQFLTLVLGIFLLVLFLIHSRRIYLRQTLLILAAALTPVVTLTVYMLSSPVRGQIDPIAYSLIASSLLLAWGILRLRLRLMDLMPVVRDKLVEDLQDSLLVIDDQEQVIDLNPAAVRFLGLDRRRAVGMPADLVLAEFPELLELCRSCQQDTMPETITLERRGLVQEADVSLLRAHNGLRLGCMLLLRDITANRRAEEERLALERQVHQKQRLESLGLMAGGIAHDFNNLLTVIVGNLELALFWLASDTANVRYSLEQAKSASARAAELIRLILAYSGKGIFLFQPVNLSLAVQESLQTAQPGRTAAACLKTELPEDLPAVSADPDKLAQVILTLFDNAVEALGDLPGEITVRTGVMEAGESYLRRSRTEQHAPAGEYVFLETADTGCGMDDNTLQHLFDPFFSTKATGRGLGMSAVMGIVSAHRGAIIVDTQPGRGTTVRVLLPVIAAT